jgi:hypothetical protein
MKIKLIAAAFILNAAFLSAQTAPSKAENGSGDVVEHKAGARGADPEVKKEKRANSATTETKVVQPPSKGARSRGGYCSVVFDNWSGYYLDCYIDGYYEGYVGPYSNGSMTVSGGITRAYAKAEFDDGSYRSWGPVTANCAYSTLTMTIYSTFYNSSVE